MFRSLRVLGIAVCGHCVVRVLRCAGPESGDICAAFTQSQPSGPTLTANVADGRYSLLDLSADRCG